MCKLRQHWRLAAVLGFGLFYLIFWLLARDIIESGKEITSDGREEQESDEISDVTVTLIVENPGYTQSFRESLTSQESVIDLLEKVRGNGQVTYEIVQYTYGTELVSVNGVVATQGSKWSVYEDGFEIANFANYNLSDGKVYSLGLRPL